MYDHHPKKMNAQPIPPEVQRELDNMLGNLEQAVYQEMHEREVYNQQNKMEKLASIKDTQCVSNVVPGIVKEVEEKGVIAITRHGKHVAVLLRYEDWIGGKQ